MSASRIPPPDARADALAAFLAWPGPGSPAPRGPGLQLRATLLTLALGLVLSVCSMLAPIAGAVGVGWGTGAGSHLLLFCHLSI